MPYRLLDLFCGAGGAGTGYARAGFEVVGVDIARQPHYPYRFYRSDALEFAKKYGSEFDVIHASPVCKGYSSMTNCRAGLEHPMQISDVRDVIMETKKLYVIENVVGAREFLVDPIMLCGLYFRLKVYRHRLFEVNRFLLQPKHIPHRDNTPKAGHGGKSKRGFISVAGHVSDVPYASWAMGIDWMTQRELAEAIPPAYTEWLGGRLIAILEDERKHSKGDEYADPCHQTGHRDEGQLPDNGLDCLRPRDGSQSQEGRL